MRLKLSTFVVSILLVPLILTSFLQIASAQTILLQDSFDTENGGVGTLNYNGFANWDVTDGTVDLIGNGFFDFYPGNGLYVDLDGSSGNAGRMESKTTFALPEGTCELSFELGGSQRGDTNTVHVALGSIYSESFTLDSDDPLALISKTIIVNSASSGELSFDHEGTDNIGLILDDVTLTCTEITPRPPVGGELVTIDMASLFIAGLSANGFWMLPTISGMIGATIAALIALRRK
jgi:hypothetical protein